MDTLKKIVEAQDLLLKALAGCEATVAELYGNYATRFPEMGDFWNGLAEEEHKHAALLEEVRDELRQGVIMRGLDHFEPKQVRALVDYVRARVDEVQQGKTTKSQAVAIALSIESSIIDSRFFDFAQSNGSAFQNVAERLSHDTKEHIKMVQRAEIALNAAK
jgi:hypothetical protein